MKTTSKSFRFMDYTISYKITLWVWKTREKCEIARTIEIECKKLVFAEINRYLFEHPHKLVLKAIGFNPLYHI